MHVNAKTWRLILYVQYNSLVCKMLKFPHFFHINKMQPQKADVKALKTCELRYLYLLMEGILFKAYRSFHF